MAISQMQKLSLILPKVKLDEVLLTLQELRDVEIRPLPKEEDWQQAFSKEEVQLPEIQHVDGKKDLTLKGEEALYYLSKRQQKLEMVIRQIEDYLPKKSLKQKLKQKKREFSFETVQLEGTKLDETQLLKKVRNLFKERATLEEKGRQLEEDIAGLRKWSGLETTPQALSKFKHVKALVGTVPSQHDDADIRALKDTEGIDFQEVYHTETEYGLILFIHPQVQKRDTVNLDNYNFHPFDYPHETLPKDRLLELTEKRQKYLEHQLEIEDELQKAEPILEDLELQLEYILNLHKRQTAKQYLASSQHLVALEGWIETEKLSRLKEEIIHQFGDFVLLQEVDVSPEDWQDVPIKLKNHPLIEPFELVTEMYALPKYHEKDPTPILAPFYFTFFGMMVADLGYGLLMILATAFALKMISLSKGTARFMRFFKLLGISVSIWGLIYGSFLGYALPMRLISTTDDVMTILILSVAFGFVTVVTGLFLGGRQKVRMKDYGEAYSAGFAWCLILFGFLLLALGNLTPELAYLGILGQWLAITNAIGILLVSLIKAKSFAGIGSGLFNLYNVSGYIGDLVSFTRLMALGLSGASIGSAFNLIVGLFPPTARFTVGILIFILLHGINIFLSLLSGYVHGARLMFVEFFGKFYEGGGRAFNPLRPAEKHITIINKVHLEDK